MLKERQQYNIDTLGPSAGGKYGLKRRRDAAECHRDHDHNLRCGSRLDFILVIEQTEHVMT